MITWIIFYNTHFSTNTDSIEAIVKMKSFKNRV
jgi:hypothetical protein